MIVTENAIRHLDGGEGSTLSCIVGRSLCLFMRVDASNVPPKQRRDFVGLAVRRAAPFETPDFGMASVGNGRMAVWYWSQARVAEHLTFEGARPRRIRYSPEALHVKTETVDGGELLALEAGVEGRAWKSGELVASRWWPETPAIADWREFLRGAGLRMPEGAGVPAVTPAETTTATWGAHDGFRRGAISLGGMETHLPTAMLALAGVVAAVASVQVGAIVRSHVDTMLAERRSDQMDESITRVLAAREAADRNAAEIDALLALRMTHSAVSLISEATRLLPASGWSIKHWQQPTPDRLELTLVMPDADPQQLVTAWEASPMFSEVTTDILGRSGEVVVRASILPPDSTP